MFEQSGEGEERALRSWEAQKVVGRREEGQKCCLWWKTQSGKQAFQSNHKEYQSDKSVNISSGAERDPWAKEGWKRRSQIVLS